MSFEDISLHNVATTAPAEWAEGGARLSRAPDAVRANVNVNARERLAHPTGSELRFVPDGEVDVTLSARAPTTVHPFWGAFQSREPFEIGPEPTTHTLSVPERVGKLRSDADTGAFAPRVCRLRFDAWVPVALHGVAGSRRAPSPEELPDTDLLAYGTSITEGMDASAPHLTYVGHTARALGADAYNLGCSGSAFCEPAMADYLAEREFDAAVLSVSVNMANRGFTLEGFRERVASLVETVAGANPETPVLAVTLFPYHADAVAGDNPERAAAFRRALREAVREAECPNLGFVEGPELMDTPGLSDDLLHPGDAGMAAAGLGLADALREFSE